MSEQPEVVVGLEVDETEAEIPTRALVPIESADALLAKASMLLRSGFLPPHIRRPEQAVAIMLRGIELGIGPMEALTSINMIQGKVSSSTQLMLALIYRSGQLEDISMVRGDPAKVTMKRRAMTAHTATFGSTDAGKMNLMHKSNYKKFPEVMFLWRAIAICSRVVFPDIIGAIYTPDELGVEINSDRVFLDVDWKVMDVATSPAPATWQELLSQTGKTVDDLGGVEAALAMTPEQVKAKWEAWKND